MKRGTLAFVSVLVALLAGSLWFVSIKQHAHDVEVEKSEDDVCKIESASLGCLKCSKRGGVHHDGLTRASRFHREDKVGNLDLAQSTMLTSAISYVMRWHYGGWHGWKGGDDSVEAPEAEAAAEEADGGRHRVHCGYTCWNMVVESHTHPGLVVNATYPDAKGFPHFLNGCSSYEECGSLDWSCRIEDEEPRKHAHLRWESNASSVAVLRVGAVLLVLAWIGCIWYSQTDYASGVSLSRLLQLETIIWLLTGVAAVFLFISIRSAGHLFSSLGESLKRGKMTPAQCSVQNATFDYLGADIPAELRCEDRPCWLLNVSQSAVASEQSFAIVQDFNVSDIPMELNQCDSFASCNSTVLPCLVTRDGTEIEMPFNDVARPHLVSALAVIVGVAVSFAFSAWVVQTCTRARQEVMDGWRPIREGRGAYEPMPSA